jgi:hypothetical protein
MMNKRIERKIAHFTNIETILQDAITINRNLKERYREKQKEVEKAKVIRIFRLFFVCVMVAYAVMFFQSIELIQKESTSERRTTICHHCCYHSMIFSSMLRRLIYKSSNMTLLSSDIMSPLLNLPLL